ncbi:hypothetical protein [Pseudonocardia sp.]|uniref:hypothetical protein n=1 Tax=Pseudonocardia sp. TaxID=60912 RepID=UPI0031FDC9AC
MDEQDWTGLWSRAQASHDRARDLRARLAFLAAKIADTEDVVAATFERRADDGSERAAELRAKAGAARRFAEFERRESVRFARAPIRLIRDGQA